jgi:hypothetical protein
MKGIRTIQAQASVGVAPLRMAFQSAKNGGLVFEYRAKAHSKLWPKQSDSLR